MFFLHETATNWEFASLSFLILCPHLSASLISSFIALVSVHLWISTALSLCGCGFGFFFCVFRSPSQSVSLLQGMFSSLSVFTLSLPHIHCDVHTTQKFFDDPQETSPWASLSPELGLKLSACSATPSIS